MLEDWQDLAVLWDIRVRPENRRRGIGKQLFRRSPKPQRVLYLKTFVPFVALVVSFLKPICIFCSLSEFICC